MNGHEAAVPHGIDITPFISLLIIASVVAMFAQRIRLPYALALVITGLLVGAPHLLPNVHLEPHTLFTVFLPPLLFESAINLRADILRRNWLPIAIFALAGTLLAAGIVGGLVHLALGLPLLVALLFGALISPTDPISVIALFKRLGVGKRLAVLVEAESLFNDGVAVVVFGVLLGAVGGAQITAGGTLVKFVTVVAGGAGIGLLIGAAMSRVTRYFDDHLLEIMLTTVVAFGSYLFAEALHVSGVIAVVVAGLVVGNYGIPTGMSPTTRLAVHSFWEYAAFAVNSLVFLLVGIEVTYLDIWDKLVPIGIAIGAVLAGRAVSIYGLSLLANGMKADVPFTWQHVFFWGGLRGALSMALVLSLPRDMEFRNTLVVLTFGVVLFSLLAQGLTVEPLLRRLKLVGRASRESEYSRIVGQMFAARAAGAELTRMHEERLIPRNVLEPLGEAYQARIDRLEQEAEALHLSDEELRARQICEAKRRALIAEKAALQEAWRSGLIQEEDLRHLEEGIDAQLADLQAQNAH